MKKFIYGIIALLSVTMSSKADGLVVANMGIQSGKKATVEVYLNATDDTYRAVLFTLSLPDDVTISTKSGELDIEVSPIAENAGYGVTANQLTDGAYRFAMISTSGSNVIPTDGSLFTFTIEASESLAVGTVLTASLSDIALTDAYAVDHHTDDVTFTISIYEPRTILDENSASLPETATGIDVRVKRTIKANQWSTICLPFAMTAEQVKTAFGSEVQLGDFTGCEATYDETGKNLVALNVNFADATAIEANHPYIIKVTENMSEFIADGVDIEVEEEPTVDCDRIGKGTNRDPYRYNSFVGNYIVNTVVPDMSLFISDNKFWYSRGQTKMKAFRAYFDFYDVLTEVEENAAARINMNFVDDQSTGIDDSLKKKTGANDKLYDLQGRMVKTPKKGLYIRNGRKEIVK